MFTAFMLALTLTSVADLLATMATEPLLTALFARVTLGILWMYAAELGAGSTRDVLGTGVALLVTLASATNWTPMQHTARVQGPERIDLLPRAARGRAALERHHVAFGVAAADGWPRHRPARGLGVFQLTVPCLLVVVVARHLSAPEVSLLSLLEVVFGVAWVWLLVDEVPSNHTLWGGGLVLAALVGAELVALVSRSPRLGRLGEWLVNRSG